MYLIKPWYKPSTPIVDTKIYGVYWDGSASSSLDRTDDSEYFNNPVAALDNGNGSSPFDDIMPWAGMRRIEDPNAGILVKIPKFYFKLNIDDTTGALSLKISMYQHPGFMVSPAHRDRGDGKGERDVVYVGAYHCVDNYKSLSGALPIGSATIANARTGIHALGSDIWQWDISMLYAIQMLYIVEYAEWNSQAAIGYGCSYEGGSAGAYNNGTTDSMIYHTGTVRTTRSESGSTRYRYIEGLWDNGCDLIDGLYFDGSNNSNIYLIDNPSNFNNGSNGIVVATTSVFGTEQYIKHFKQSTVPGYEWFYIPSEINTDGENYEYICDTVELAANDQYVRTSCPRSRGSAYGLFHYNGTRFSSHSDYNSARLQKLP